MDDPFLPSVAGLLSSLSSQDISLLSRIHLLSKSSIFPPEIKAIKYHSFLLAKYVSFNIKHCTENVAIKRGFKRFYRGSYIVLGSNFRIYDIIWPSPICGHSIFVSCQVEPVFHKNSRPKLSLLLFLLS